MRRQKTTLAATLGLVFCGVLGLTTFAHSGTIDAISGASIQILGGKTDTNSATINWKVTNGDARGSGTLTLYYNTSSATSGAKTAVIPSSARKSEGTSATYTLTGLTAATKYWFWMRITSGNFLATGSTDTMRTDAHHSASVLQRSWVPSGTRSSNVDPLGRRIQFRSPVQINQSGTQIELTQGHR